MITDISRPVFDYAVEKLYEFEKTFWPEEYLPKTLEQQQESIKQISEVNIREAAQEKFNLFNKSLTVVLDNKNEIQYYLGNSNNFAKRLVAIPIVLIDVTLQVLSLVSQRVEVATCVIFNLIGALYHLLRLEGGKSAHSLHFASHYLQSTILNLACLPIELAEILVFAPAQLILTVANPIFSKPSSINKEKQIASILDPSRGNDLTLLRNNLYGHVTRLTAIPVSVVDVSLRIVNILTSTLLLITNEQRSLVMLIMEIALFPLNLISQIASTLWNPQGSIPSGYMASCVDDRSYAFVKAENPQNGKTTLQFEARVAKIVQKQGVWQFSFELENSVCQTP